MRGKTRGVRVSGGAREDTGGEGYLGVRGVSGCARGKTRGVRESRDCFYPTIKHPPLDAWWGLI